MLPLFLPGFCPSRIGLDAPSPFLPLPEGRGRVGLGAPLTLLPGFCPRKEREGLDSCLHNFGCADKNLTVPFSLPVGRK